MTSRLSRLPAILIPLLAGGLYLALYAIKLPNLLYYGLASTASVVIPALFVCITLVLIFHILKHFSGLRIASIITFLLALSFGLISFFATPDGHLADLLESIYLTSDPSEVTVITDESLYREYQKYPPPKTPVLPDYPDSADHLWLISHLPSEDSSSSPLEGYEITDQISTPYYLALKLQKV